MCAEVDPIPTLQSWQLSSDATTITGSAFGYSPAPGSPQIDNGSVSFELDPSIDRLTLQEGSWVTSCDNIAYRLGLPCPSASHRDEEEDQKKVTKNNQAAANGNPYSVLSSTLDHVTLTVQSEEAVEENSSTDMKMQEDQEKQVEERMGMNTDVAKGHRRRVL